MQAVASLEITSRSEAEQACRRGVRVASLKAGAEAARDTAVAAAGEVNKDRIERLSTEQALIEAALEKWARKNRSNEFAGKQELDLAAGVLAFRVGNRYLGTMEGEGEGEGWKKEVLKQIIRAGRVLAAWRSWVKIKFDLDIRKILSDSQGDKPKLTEQKLASVGLKVHQDEAFSVVFRVEAKP